MNHPRTHPQLLPAGPSEFGAADDPPGEDVVRQLADHVYELVSQGHGLEPVVASLLGRRASGTALTAVARLARSEAMQSGPDDHWLGVARKIDLVQNFCSSLFDMSCESVTQ